MAQRRRRKRRSAAPGGELSFFSFQDIITSVTGILLLVTLIMAASLTSNPGPETTPAPAAISVPIINDPEADATTREKIAALLKQVAHTDEGTQKLSRGLIVVSDILTFLPAPTAESLDQLVSTIPQLHAQSSERIRVVRDELERLRREIEATKVESGRLSDGLAEAQQQATRSTDLTFIRGNQTAEPLLVELDESEVRIGRLDAEGRPQLLASATYWNWESAFDDALVDMDTKNITVVIMVHPKAVDRLEDVRDEIKSRRLPVGWDVAPGRKVFERSQPSSEGEANAPTP